MPTSSPDDDRSDSDPTDELPILLETAVLDSEQRESRGTVLGDDDTGEYAVHHPELGDNEIELLGSEFAARLETLNAEIADLKSKAADAASLLAEKDASIEHLREALTVAEETLADRAATAERLAHEASAQATRIDELRNALELQRAVSSLGKVELDDRETDAAPPLAARHDVSESVLAAPTLRAEAQALREELTALAGHIANRNAAWNELSVKAASAEARNVEFERELGQRKRWDKDAAQTMERQRQRIDALRTQVFDLERQREALRAQLEATRAAVRHPETHAARLEADVATGRATIARLQAELAASLRDRELDRAAAESNRLAHAEALATAASRATDALQSLTATSVATLPTPSLDTPVADHAREVALLAELEREVEMVRSQLEIERRASNDLIPRLEAATRDLAESKRQVVVSAAEIEKIGADNARLERSLLDKDRALEAREDRIASLQKEIEQRSQAQPLGPAIPPSDADANRRQPHSVDYTGGTPLLVCLTSDTPQRYPLTKKMTLIGRSSQCDIQILTHFVSREHARVTVDRATATIEDLGSTNGVFVNSVRIDRHQLRHSDIVTVGETQFRFLETVAH